MDDDVSRERDPGDRVGGGGQGVLTRGEPDESGLTRLRRADPELAPSIAAAAVGMEEVVDLVLFGVVADAKAAVEKGAVPQVPAAAEGRDGVPKCFAAVRDSKL